MTERRITLLTYGSRGDVQPFVALGLGLQRAGHAVRLAAPAVFADFVRGYGLDFYPLPGDPAGLVRALVERGRGRPLPTLRAVYDHAVPLGREVLAACRDACRGADSIVHSFLLTLAGHEAARATGAAEFSAQLFPTFCETGRFPAIALPGFSPGAAYNRLTHRLFSAAFWHGSRLGYATMRRRDPGLAPLSGWPFAGPRPVPILFAFSPHVIPPPPEWSGRAAVTGYWFLPEQDWQPPAVLTDFLAAGPPPVYIGFGSTIAGELARLIDLAREALRLAGQRGIIAAGWGGGAAGQAGGDDLLWLEDAPHGWLFPRCAALVHHGGAGTTAAGLRAGVPQALTPFASDQPFWARIVRGLGAGPDPIPPRRLTAERLAGAIRQAAGDPALRARAAALGQAIRAEDGVAQAVALITGG